MNNAAKMEYFFLLICYNDRSWYIIIVVPYFKKRFGAPSSFQIDLASEKDIIHRIRSYQESWLLKLGAKVRKLATKST